jgi:hypothetical protein
MRAIEAYLLKTFLQNIAEQLTDIIQKGGLAPGGATVEQVHGIVQKCYNLVNLLQDLTFR